MRALLPRRIADKNMSEIMSPPLPKILLVTNEIEAEPRGGRALLCRLNRDVLLDIYGGRLAILELPRSPLKGVTAYFNAFRGFIDGLNKNTLKRGLHILEADSFAKIFVDGSNLGKFVFFIKQRLPHVEIVTFHHNVESRFFLGALKQFKTLRALAVLVVNYLAERRSVRFSDKIICLSKRDSGLLDRIYGRSATHISAIALRDRPSGDQGVRTADPGFALFVGGGFYANLAGIRWFVREVVPRIRIRTCIVGLGFEELASELAREKKVEVIGAVDSLAPWYRDANFVVAPIFDGSGMKTKVAEALMFGKRVVGTPEAFSGYEDVASRAGWRCETADDFVAAINLAENTAKDVLDRDLRSIYEASFSYPAYRRRIERIMED